MKLTRPQIESMVTKVFNHLKAQKIATFKASEDVVFRRAVDIVVNNYQQEVELEQEVNRRLDELEVTNAGEFQRFKMFPIYKKKLAKERGFIL
jgi:hypothetical protein